ncbi:MAG: hypothetical protein JWR03_1082 [Cohnella sp.]|nr:hypothetical protein [Cohnella sp.]
MTIGAKPLLLKRVEYGKMASGRWLTAVMQRQTAGWELRAVRVGCQSAPDTTT